MTDRESPNAKDIGLVRAATASVPSTYAHLRRYVRVQLTAKCLLNIGQEWHTCRLTDLSGGGAQVVLPPSVTLKTGDTAQIQFRIGLDYAFDASVVWTECTRWGTTRIGVTWVDVHEEVRDRLVLELLRLTVQRKRRR